LGKISARVEAYREGDVAGETDEDSRMVRGPVLQDAVLVRGEIGTGPGEVAEQIRDLLVRRQVPREVLSESQGERHRHHQQPHDGRVEEPTRKSPRLFPRFADWRRAKQVSTHFFCKNRLIILLLRMNMTYWRWTQT
jgi:hypothetical protein